MAQHPPKMQIVPVLLAGLVVGMVGLSYAAVPLYKVFCQVTGYGGTTQVADLAPAQPLERMITVRFDANVAPGMGWAFKPKSAPQKQHIGEPTLAKYTARNLSDHAITGQATFNVAPAKAGLYFSKIACFCFTEQTLNPGEEVDMPVTYFIDPEIVNDPDLQGLDTITLSYTFFPKEPADVDNGT